MEKRRDNHHKDVKKICGICDDKAIGYNFNAITCESCKAFFRRNALTIKEFICPFGGKCEIDLITRRFCQKCRLKKCFDIGMKKEWILSEKEKQIKRNKIEENRQKRQKVRNDKAIESTTCMNTNINPNKQLIISSDSISFDAENSPTKLDSNDLIDFDSERVFSTAADITHENTMSRKWDKIPYSFMRSKSINYNSFCDSIIHNSIIDHNQEELYPYPPSHSDSISTSTNLQNCGTSELFQNRSFDESLNPETLKNSDIPDIVFQKVIELEFSNINIRDRSVENNDNHYINNVCLNGLEYKRLTELENAMSYIGFNGVTQITSEIPTLMDAFKMGDILIRRVVGFVKKIIAFENLCQDDQISLLKSNCNKIILFRSIKKFNFEKEYWTVMKEDHNATLVKMDLYKQAKNKNIYDAHKKLMLSLKQEWNDDNHILNLCTAIILFTPDSSQITIHKDVIKLEQQTYMHLLQKYLESKYSFKCEAKNRFLRIMAILEDLHRLNKEHIRLFLDIDPNEIGPLVVEVFDLKY